MRDLRYKHKGLLSDFDTETSFVPPDNAEVFRLESLLIRKDAKRALSLWLRGYNSEEIAKILGHHKRSIYRLTHQLRKKARKALENDIRIYNNSRNE